MRWGSAGQLLHPDVVRDTSGKMLGRVLVTGSYFLDDLVLVTEQEQEDGKVFSQGGDGRCTSTTYRGSRCKLPAVEGGRCKLHQG